MMMSFKIFSSLANVDSFDKILSFIFLLKLKVSSKSFYYYIADSMNYIMKIKCSINR